MKWLTLFIGAVIVIAGAWIMLSPENADSPETPTFEEGEAMEKKDGDAMENNHMEGGTMMENEAMEKKDDGVMEGGASVNVDASASATTQTQEPEGEPMGDPIFHALVEYTDNGYVPARVTIKKGETVRFVNNSTRGNWVGGDNHPSHTIYPEKSASDCLGTSFDTCRALQAGEFWEFTFNHTGSWGYHNHIRARDGGTVVVQ